MRRSPTPSFKRRWFADGEDWRVEEFTADFRPAGHETSRFRYGDGPPITNHTRYLDIVTDERLVFSYVMTMDEATQAGHRWRALERLPCTRGNTTRLHRAGAVLRRR